MFRVTTLVINGTPGRDNKTVQSLYEQFGVKVPSACRKQLFIYGTWMEIPLIEGSPELDELLKQCDQSGLSVRAVSRAHYSKKELEQCEFFQIVPPYPTELDGVDLKNFGNVYDGACSVCGVGGELRRDVLVDRKYLRKYKMGIIQPELYMSGEVKTLVEENRLTGLSFNRKMVDYKGREIADFYVPDFGCVLPPMSGSTWLNPQAPEKCGHRIVYLQSDIQYEREKLSGAKDFNLTQEHLNNWQLREVIVSARARKVLQQNKIFCRYLPVLLI